MVTNYFFQQQNAVHGTMAGFTGFSVGKQNVWRTIFNMLLLDSQTIIWSIFCQVFVTTKCVCFQFLNLFQLLLGKWTVKDALGSAYWPSPGNPTPGSYLVRLLLDWTARVKCKEFYCFTSQMLYWGSLGCWLPSGTMLDWMRWYFCWRCRNIVMNTL